jgi:hypothetical protein
VVQRDWVEWHRDYDDPGSLLSRRGKVQIVMGCGIFGNITDSDTQATVAALPSLRATGALVLWTRHLLAPDLTPAIRSWFKEAGFQPDVKAAPVARNIPAHKHSIAC